MLTQLALKDFHFLPRFLYPEKCFFESIHLQKSDVFLQSIGFYFFILYELRVKQEINSKHGRAVLFIGPILVLALILTELLTQYFALSDDQKHDKLFHSYQLSDVL